MDFLVEINHSHETHYNEFTLLHRLVKGEKWPQTPTGLSHFISICYVIWVLSFIIDLRRIQLCLNLFTVINLFTTLPVSWCYDFSDKRLLFFSLALDCAPSFIEKSLKMHGKRFTDAKTMTCFGNATYSW